MGYETPSLNVTVGPPGVQPNMDLWQLILMSAVFGLFFNLTAMAFNYIRRNVYRDQDNLDTVFDAGGRVSVGLTATTIVSQWIWAATLLQSSAVAAMYGISGPYWYAAGATIQILLYAMLSVQLKVRAPGAKTFLQVIRARFDKKTHIVYCMFALTTNVIVTAMLMLGGVAVLKSLVHDLSTEMATLLLTAVIGSYTMIGGLGATFYVSYFNTGIIFITMLSFIMKVYVDQDNEQNPLGSVEKVYHYLNRSMGPAENEDFSFLTFRSYSGLTFGIINIVGNFGTVFVDQSYWQSSVAARPKQGVWGFLLGGLTWFSVPFSFATTMGLAFIALVEKEGSELLSSSHIKAGLVPPLVAQKVMGSTGETMVIVMIMMAIISTGSAEVMAVTSILVYDIYQVYIKPFRAVLDANSCILCGRARGRLAHKQDTCNCESITHCADCEEDNANRESCKRALKPDFKCRIHGNFKKYHEYLGRLKNWCITWTTVAIIPLTMFLDALEVSLNWVYLFMGILIGSAVLPIILAMFWERLTSKGMFFGALSGTCLGTGSWLIVAATYGGGLQDFRESTGKEFSMLTGNLVSLLTGAFVTVIVSVIGSKQQSDASKKETWENTRDIDNPLKPWAETYVRELGMQGAHRIDNRPSLEDVTKTFTLAKKLSIWGSVTLSVVFILIWPAIMATLGSLDLHLFRLWVITSMVWAFCAGAFILIMPLVNEIYEIRKTVHSNKRVNVTRSSKERRNTDWQPPSNDFTKAGCSIELGGEEEEVGVDASYSDCSASAVF
ncbi:urea-proton symporter DUR3-like [Lingula anatina]|uniref:Urea-proton symporter DUR3-like n=1 Tax=Lingula anatina TaxID=7574 RepID=A0A1S3JS90_LINAN|nr:urea-proton symporter DUR3-like [Lingula anatina]|eukprot:XP_013412874.1 urea-proton symporter DUR3-like [Lingula anatina]